MSDKKVLYVGGFELPNKNAAAQRVVSNGLILNELNYKVIYLGLNRSSKGNAVTRLDVNEEVNSYYQEPYPGSFLDWIIYIYSIKNIIKLSDIYQPDIIIVYNYPAIALYRLKRFCKKKNITLIADCTEWYQPKGNLIYRLIKGFDTFFRMRIINFKLDGLIVISKFLQEYYSNKPNRVLLLPPLIDSRDSKWINNNNSISKTVFVYAGSPGTGSKDRLDVIINEFIKFHLKNPNFIFEFKVIGISKEDYIKSFNVSSKVQELNDEIIKFKGRLSHLSALDEIKKSDFSIFIRQENLINTAGFPTKLVESISCGVPVITNPSSNINDFLTDGHNGYILPNLKSETFEKVFEKIALLSNEDLDRLKFNCKYNNLFDFRKYIKDFNRFLLNVTK